jgi:hypothetical protein
MMICLVCVCVRACRAYACLSIPVSRFEVVHRFSQNLASVLSLRSSQKRTIPFSALSSKNSLDAHNYEALGDI